MPCSILSSRNLKDVNSPKSLQISWRGGQTTKNTTVHDGKSNLLRNHLNFYRLKQTCCVPIQTFIIRNLQYKLSLGCLWLKKAWKYREFPINSQDFHGFLFHSDVTANISRKKQRCAQGSHNIFSFFG